MPASPAQRRYNRHALLLSATYAVLLIASILAFQKLAPTGVLAVIIAILPALPIVGMFAAIAHYLFTETDEYLRLMSLRQSLVASGLALSVATIWGFLESFEVAPHIDAYYIAVVWFGGLGLGSCVNYLLERRG